jgi:hypothetical protein
LTPRRLTRLCAAYRRASVVLLARAVRKAGSEFKFGHGGARIGAGRPPNFAPPRYAPPDILHWYCVHTDSGANLTADMAIRLAGFVLFAPTLWKPATPMRRDAGGSVRLAKPDRIAPLFPRDMFVQFSLADPAWRAIRDLPGVDRINSGAAGNRASAGMPDGAIDRVRGLPGFALNGCLYPERFGETPSDEAPLDVGVAVRFLTGSMADQPDLRGICKWSDGQRVKLLLEIMGREVLVDMPRRDIVAA